MHNQNAKVNINGHGLSEDTIKSINTSINPLLTEGLALSQVVSLGNAMADLHRMNLFRRDGTDTGKNWCVYYSHKIATARSMALNAATLEEVKILKAEAKESPHTPYYWGLKVARGLLRDEAFNICVNTMLQMGESVRDSVIIAKDFSNAAANLAECISNHNINAITSAQTVFDAWKAGVGVAKAVPQPDDLFKLFVYHTKEIKIEMVQNPISEELCWEAGMIRSEK